MGARRGPMPNTTRAHWLDRGPGEAVIDNNEIVNMIAFIMFVLGITFAFFGYKRCQNRRAKEEEQKAAAVAAVAAAAVAATAAP